VEPVSARTSYAALRWPRFDLFFGAAASEVAFDIAMGTGELTDVNPKCMDAEDERTAEKHLSYAVLATKRNI
jgi:hypothetical protein